MPATLSLTLGAPVSFGAFTPGVDAHLQRLDDGQRDLLGRRRDAVGRRPEHEQPGPARQRHVRAGAAARGPAGDGRLRGGQRHAADAEDATPARSPTTRSTLDFQQRIGANEPLRTGTYSQDAHLHAEHDELRKAKVPAMLTSLVGSYPQPEWLLDREKLRGRLPPRVRATRLLADRPAVPRGGAGRGHARRDPRPGARRAGHHHRRRDPARVLLQPRRDGARRRRRRQPRHDARPQRQPVRRCRASSGRSRAAARSWCATPSSCARTPTA